MVVVQDQITPTVVQARIQYSVQSRRPSVVVAVVHIVRGLLRQPRAAVVVLVVVQATTTVQVLVVRTLLVKDMLVVVRMPM